MSTIDVIKNLFMKNNVSDMVIFVFSCNQFGFSHCEFQITTKKNPFLDMQDSMSLPRPFLTWAFFFMTSCKTNRDLQRTVTHFSTSERIQKAAVMVPNHLWKHALSIRNSIHTLGVWEGGEGMQLLKESTYMQSS